MLKEYVIGIDVGTSGTKTALYDRNGKTVAGVTFDYPMMQPKNGWAEQNPEDWWVAASSGIKEMVKAAGDGKILAVGLTGQMHGLVMLDANCKVLRPAIIWCDQRTGKECEEIERRVTRERLIGITANPALTGFTASKILWVRNNEPEVYEKCAHILLPKDYIRFRLTGEFATDVSDASGMQLLDVGNRCWSDEVLRLLEIDRSLLGTVYESPEVSGRVTDAASAITGLDAGIPVAAGAGDNATAAVGTGTVTDSSAFTTIGTSGVVYMHTSTPKIDPKGRVHTFCCAVPGEWHVMGVTQAAGLSLRWLRDTFCAEEQAEAKATGCDIYDIMCSMAEKSPIGADGLIYLPYLMGERTPHLDPNARGCFFGISAVHGKNDFIRSVLEGVSYSLADCLGVFGEMGAAPVSMAACGGGGSSPMWRKMLADIYDCPVSTVAPAEGPALGAAILGMVCCGMYGSVREACEQIVRLSQTCVPSAEAHERYMQIYGLYKELYPSLRESYAKLSAVR